MIDFDTIRRELAIDDFEFSIRQRPTQGKLITFGKHKGKTIEQIHFIDFGWLAWASELPNRRWIKTYMQNLPEIFPNKIKVQCGQKSPYGCKTSVATRISVTRDEKGIPVVSPGAAYYWCEDCWFQYQKSTDHRFDSATLQFESVLYMKMKGNIAGFHKIMRHAYGIKRLTAETAQEVFWG